MKNKIVVWEKWRDPFTGYDEDEIDIDNDKLDNFFDDNPEDNGILDDKIDEFSIKKNKINQQVRVIATPMGLIPYNEYTASSRIFNFWIGHTNFNITKQIMKIIEETDGVETLDIFTRYRFRIGIGKAFEDREVMTNIDSQIKNNE